MASTPEIAVFDLVAAFDLVEVALLLVDGQRRIKACNAAFLCRSGRSAADLLGRDLADALAADGASRQALDQAWAQANQSDQPLAALDIDASDADGLGWPLRLSGRRLADAWVLTLQSRADDSAWRAEQQRLNGMLDLARDLGRLGLCERDLRTGQGHWDQATWRLWGMAPQVTGPTVEQILLHLVEADRLLLRRALQGSYSRVGLGDLPLRVIWPDGQERRLHAHWEVQAGPDGKPIRMSGVVRDDTEVYRLARSVSQTQAQWRLAAELVELTVWRRDLQRNEIHLDPKGREMLLLPRSEQGLPLGEFAALVHPDDLPEASRHGVLRAEASALAAPDLTLRLRRRDGQWRYWLMRGAAQTDEAGAVLGMVGVALDVTERHTAEAKLRKAGERALLVARGAGIGTWESSPDAELGWWDAQMFALRGLAPQATPVTLQAMLGWVHPEDRLAITEKISANALAGLPYMAEFRVVWPDGSVRWLASRSAPVRDSAGQVISRIGINWDVTEARNAAAAQQDKLQAQHDKLLAQRENQAKSRFLARMSHELRTPLNAVLGFSQLLLATDPDAAVADPDRWRQQVEHVRAAGEHLLTLVNDVLDLSSLESGDLPLHLQPVCMATFAHTTLPMLQTQADAAGVSLQSGRLSGQALADPVRLRQILINLLSNAIKYNRAQGRVWIEAQPVDGRLRLSVSDDGLGMSPAQCSHLFEPFNRLGRERDGVDGTGIGLAIVHALVTRMGGTIQVSSRLGEGSCFEVDLPLADSAAHPPPAAPWAVDARPETPPGPAAAMPTPAPTPVSQRLLYIEDNPVNQLIVAGLIAMRPDLALDLADDGTDGLRQARSLRHALLLVDMQLPDIDGLEVLAQLRADPATAGLRCVALSANAMPEDILAARRAGFDDYWTKPLDVSAFHAALAGLLGPATATPV